jgi:sugar/nucleoside kinase (ribokinase family)
MDVLCVGQLAADILVRPVEHVDFGVDTRRVDGIDIRSGGDALNAALGLAKLGNRVGFCGKVGNDHLGGYLAEVIRAAGIDDRGLSRAAETTTCSCLVLVNGSGDRAFFYHGGANELFSPADVDTQLVAEASIVHVGGTFLLPRFDGEGAAGLFQRARAAGKITSMDVTWDVSGRWMSVIGPCLPHLSFFMPSIREAERIAGSSDPGRITEIFEARGVAASVVKLGEKGCFVKRRGEPGFLVPAFPTRVVDTTGAGDSFVAGFLTGLLKGWDLRRSASLACAVAALNIRKLGATGGIPTFEEAERFMERGGE